MTLQPYDSQKLDHLALQLLDIAAIVRKMANDGREHKIADLALHDRKAREWCMNLEDWAHKARADLDVKIGQARARRRAISPDS